MYFQKSHFIAVTFYIQMVYSDLTLSESGPPYTCGEGLKLKCWSDSVACCNLTTKRWTLQGTQIMNDGVEVSGTGKYTETRNDAEKYFELTIKNLELSDFGKEYACLYEFDTSPGLTLKASRFYCSPCGHCGGRCYGWSCFGTTVGFFLMYFVIHVSITKGFIDWKQHDENDEDKKCVEGKCCTNIWCRGLIAVVISFVMSLIAVPIGIEYCFCYEFVDKAYKSYPDPSFIVLGFVVVIFAFPTLGCCLILKDRKGKAICFLILCGLSAGILLLVFLIFCTEFFKRIKAKVGSDVHLECPHKEDAVGQINWIKINGTRRITYSEGTSCNLKDLPKQLIDRLTVKGRDLLISNVQESDTGIYACELIDGAAAPQVAKLELTVLSGGKNDAVPV